MSFSSASLFSLVSRLFVDFSELPSPRSSEEASDVTVKGVADAGLGLDFPGVLKLFDSRCEGDLSALVVLEASSDAVFPGMLSRAISATAVALPRQLPPDHEVRAPRSLFALAVVKDWVNGEELPAWFDAVVFVVLEFSSFLDVIAGCLVFQEQSKSNCCTQCFSGRCGQSVGTGQTKAISAERHECDNAGGLRGLSPEGRTVQACAPHAPES